MPGKLAWERVAELFHEALQQSAPARSDFLVRACGGDGALLREIESLLQHADDPPISLDLGARIASIDSGIPAWKPLTPGTTIGAYRIEGMLGHGGMGEVYVGRRADGQFDHRVAIKLLRPEAVDHADRFKTERQILARLEHPGIARLFDGGTTAEGRLYIVMEWVRGEPVTEYCRTRTLSLDARLDLFQKICDAVAFAHAHLVVHRDLKPANILVAEDGGVKLLDFGIAKLLPEGLLSEATVTQAAPLTPDHAAPEQLEGGQVTTATDVYALGILLFELLTGRLPWELRHLPVSAALSKLLHEDAPAPSSVIAQSTATPISANAVRGDLDAIVARALRKDPAQRYGTVTALSQDVDRYRKGEPVFASAGRRWYRVSKFVRRNRVAVTAGIAILVSLIGGLIASLILYQRADVARKQAQEEFWTARAINSFMTDDLLAGADESTGTRKNLTLVELLERAPAKVEKRFADRPWVIADIYKAIGDSYLGLALPDRALEFYRKAFEMAERLHGHASRQSIVALEAVANATEATGGDQCPLLADLLTRETELYGQAHWQYLWTRGDYAWSCLLGQGKDVEALAELRAVLAAAQQIHLADMDDVDDVVNNTQWRLASILRDRAEYAEAEQMLRATHEFRIRKYGDDAISVLTTRANLVYLLTDLGRYDEAEQEFAKLRPAQEKLVEPQDPVYIYDDWALGRLRLEQGRLADAEVLLDRALQANVTRFGWKNADSISFAEALADAYRRQGRLPLALKTMETTLPYARAQFANAHAQLANALILDADLLRESGRLDRARELLAEIPADAFSQLPPQHPSRAALLRVQGLVAQLSPQ